MSTFTAIMSGKASSSSNCKVITYTYNIFISVKTVNIYLIAYLSVVTMALGSSVQFAMSQCLSQIV